MTTANVPNASLTVAIIAGGKSSRMGRDKAFLELGGKTLIERVITASADLGQSETILITNKPNEYRHLGLEMHSDLLPFHFVEAAVNLLTLDKIDPRAKIPDFKLAAVKLEKVERTPTALEEQVSIKDPVRFVR